MIAAWTPPLRRAAMPDAPLRPAGAAAGPRVAYQGEPGAFGESAVAQHWAGGAVAVGAPTFGKTLGLLLARRVDAAVLPVSNSAIGPIVAAQEALYESADRLEVIDEVVVLVQHALLALPGATIDSLRVVGSHPAALGQCASFFARHPHIAPREAFDTAGAARQLATLIDPHTRASAPWWAGVAGAAPESLGAIASEGAGERHGLVVLARAIQDDARNETRFAVVRRREGVRRDGARGARR